MTPEQLREAASVMLAAADGKQVQYRHRGYESWRDFNNCSWSWDTIEYRIKPETRKVKVRVFQHAGTTHIVLQGDWDYYERYWKPISDIVEIEVRDA